MSEYILSPHVSVHIGLLEGAVLAPFDLFPRTRDFPIKYVSITISELKNNRTNSAFGSCFFLCRARSVFLLTTRPQMSHWHGST